jgi:hypothetical protein
VTASDLLACLHACRFDEHGMPSAHSQFMGFYLAFRQLRAPRACSLASGVRSVRASEPVLSEKAELLLVSQDSASASLAPVLLLSRSCGAPAHSLRGMMRWTSTSYGAPALLSLSPRTRSRKRARTGSLNPKP